MNEEDRDKLIVNCAKLVPAINWPEIFPALIKNGVYHKEDKNVQRWEKNLDSRSNNREIYLKIRNRGPKAFENFIRCLKETGHEDLARLLKPEDGDRVNNNEIPITLNTNAFTANTNDQSIRSEMHDHHIQNAERNLVSEMISTNIGNTEDDLMTDESLLHRGDMYYTHLQHTKIPLKIHLTKSTEFKCLSDDHVMCYSMTSKPRGLVLIINNVSFKGTHSDRYAAEHDENNLRDLFVQMGFEVDILSNLTREEMLDRLLAFSRRRELRHVHSTFVIIMSHGGEHVQNNCSESLVFGVDGRAVVGQEIFSLFTATACTEMCKKPKVFIFQTCRGEKKQQVVISKTVSIGRDCTDISKFAQPNITKIPMGCRDLSDVLVAYSTLPGHVAHRDRFTGSWYIQTLCEVFMNHAHNTELIDLFRMTDQRLSILHNDYRECQTSVYSSYGFNKRCYLNPGLFED